MYIKVDVEYVPKKSVTKHINFVIIIKKVVTENTDDDSV